MARRPPARGAETEAPIPDRLCIACRRVGEQAALVRFVASPDGRLVVDHPPKLKGRGAYLCPDPACVRAAAKRNPFSRALRRPVVLPSGDLVEVVADRVRAHVLGLLGVARKEGRVRSGTAQVEEALARGGRGVRGGLALLLLAADAGPSTWEEFEARARAAGTPVARFGTREELGRAIGKEHRAVVGIADPGLASRIQEDLAKLRRLAGE